MKRGISSAYISVEQFHLFRYQFHLFRYLDEKFFRASNWRGFSNATLLGWLCSRIAGKLMTYAELTRKEAGAVCYAESWEMERRLGFRFAFFSASFCGFDF